MRDFRTLTVWQKAHQLTLRIYQVTTAFPESERYGLISQMRRSSSSIPTNIAEGYGRDGDAELARFLQIGMGSASELEYQLILVRDLGFLEPELHSTLEQEVIEIKRMLATFIKKLKADR